MIAEQIDLWMKDNLGLVVMNVCLDGSLVLPREQIAPVRARRAQAARLSDERGCPGDEQVVTVRREIGERRPAVPAFRDELTQLAQTESNAYVRKIAESALDNALP